MRAGLLTSSRNLYAPFWENKDNPAFSKRKGLFEKTEYFRLGGVR